MTAGTLEVRDAPAELAMAAASAIAATVAAVQSRAPRATLALAGGGTPEAAYRALAEPPLVERVAWDRLDLFWGDERPVPPDHPSSNYGLARRALLERVPIPPSGIHRIEAELDPDEAARRYEAAIRRVLPGEAVPRLDLVLVGMGEDGHTASLFPGVAVDEARLVDAPFVPRLGMRRITATLRLLAAARALIFLVAGPGKAGALAEVLEDPASELPAARVARAHGSPTWFVDRAAAGRLTQA
jgi:6-phosphogluconolactonase